MYVFEAREFCTYGLDDAETLANIIECMSYFPYVLQNGTGKTTFVRMLAGALKSDEEEAAIKAGDADLAAELG